MNAIHPENARLGKYCPRCQTMTVLEQPVCAHCGHHFRTGPPSPAPEAPLRKADPLHRTMQFQLPTRLARPALEMEPIASSQRPWGLFPTAALLLGAIGGAFLFFRPPPAKPSPVGAWETALTSRASHQARLGIVLRDDGSGAFSWATSEGLARHGQVPLHWHLDAAGKLVLALSPPPNADAVSGTLLTIFRSHPWLWRLDTDRQRLIIGTLVFQHS